MICIQTALISILLFLFAVGSSTWFINKQLKVALDEQYRAWLKSLENVHERDDG